MNKKEFAKLMLCVDANYGKREATNETMDIFFALLKDLDYSIASKAIAKLMLTSKYCPTIADIREAYTNIINGERPNSAKAWSIFTSYINVYSTKDAYERLKTDYFDIYNVIHTIGARKLLLGTEKQSRAEFEKLYTEHMLSKKKAEMLPGAIENSVLKIAGC